MLSPTSRTCDVDELVVDEEGLSAFDLCGESPTRYVQYPGRWCYCVEFENTAWPAKIRHHHHTHNVPEWGASCPTKWVVNPSRVDRWFQWNVHCLELAEKLSCNLPGLEYRHIRGINTLWKADRTDQWHFDSTIHKEDSQLLRDFDRVGWEVRRKWEPDDEFMSIRTERINPPDIRELSISAPAKVGCLSLRDWLWEIGTGSPPGEEIDI